MTQREGRGSGDLHSWSLGTAQISVVEGVSIISDSEPRTETVFESKQDAGSQEGCPQGFGLRLLRPLSLPLLLGLLLWPLVGGRDGSLGLLGHLCTPGLRRFCLRLVGLGNGYDDGQDTDELEDGTQEEPIPQQILPFCSCIV